MCGRYTLTTPSEAVINLFALEGRPNLPARYNIAPTQEVAAVIHDTMVGGDASARQFAWLTWGLVPGWAKDKSFGARTINARAETIADKPAYRTAFAKRRCLIAADGFYEWQKPPPGIKGGKQPYWITLADRSPFAFAGLWEVWRAPDGEELRSCTIATCPPNETVAPIHDRMPVILDRADYDVWLDPATDRADALALLKPYRAGAMTTRAVSTLVNSPRNDTADCIAALLV